MGAAANLRCLSGFSVHRPDDEAAAEGGCGGAIGAPTDLTGPFSPAPCGCRLFPDREASELAPAPLEAQRWAAEPRQR